MKVNILGRGIIPTLKLVAPAMNVDIDKDTCAFIMRSQNLEIYRVADLKRITGRNIDELFASDAAPAVEEKPVVMTEIDSSEAPELPADEPKIEVPDVEDVAEPLFADEAVEETAPVEEEVSETVEETVEEASEEEVVEKPVYNKKKNKKNRNNG